MVFSSFLKRARRVVRVSLIVTGVMLVMPVSAQVAEQTAGTAVPLEAGKRPASLSAPASDTASKAPFEPDPDFTPAALKARYPLQSITTMELAKQALIDVKQGRKQIEAIFKQEEKACYKTFFANRCVAKAKDTRRIALNDIRPIQVEAERFKRHAAVVKRDEALEKNRLKAEGAESGRTPEEKRAANEAAFAKKVHDREVAQQKVIEKRARTERRRKKKAAEAAKRARQMPKPSAAASVSATTTPASTSAPVSSSFAASAPPAPPSASK